METQRTITWITYPGDTAAYVGDPEACRSLMEQYHRIIYGCPSDPVEIPKLAEIRKRGDSK